tara:strand:- start:1750 stop:1998 length:249 start_codon:yes stop_codon:yes gene_type:complete
MNKSFEKNRLDLAYQRQLHYLNGVLALATVGIFSFLGTFIWNREFLLQGLIIVTIFLIVAYYFHNKIDKNLKEISNKIKELS